MVRVAHHIINTTQHNARHTAPQKHNECSTQHHTLLKDRATQNMTITREGIPECFSMPLWRSCGRRTAGRTGREFRTNGSLWSRPYKSLYKMKTPRLPVRNSAHCEKASSRKSANLFLNARSAHLPMLQFFGQMMSWLFIAILFSITNMSSLSSG